MVENIPSFSEALKIAANDPEKAIERGKNTKVIETFTRHGIPGKTPEGMSADYIIPEGLAEIRDKGYNEKQGEGEPRYYMITGSKEVKRARESGQAYGEGIGETEMLEKINKKGPEGSKLAEFGIYAMSDLDPYQDAKVMFVPILAEGKELVKSGDLKAEDLEGWAIGKFLEISDEEFKEKGLPTKREVASRMAHRLNSGVRMSEKLYQDMDTKVNNFTHGPNVECLLKHIIKIDGKTGFDDIEKIGGALKPGENVDFTIERDDKGDLKPIKINFRGETYDFDMDEFNRLLNEYKNSKEKERIKE